MNKTLRSDIRNQTLLASPTLTRRSQFLTHGRGAGARQRRDNADGLRRITAAVMDVSQVRRRLVLAKNSQPRRRGQDRQVCVAIVIAGDHVMLIGARPYQFSYE